MDLILFYYFPSPTSEKDNYIGESCNIRWLPEHMQNEKCERKGMYMKEVYNIVKKETVNPRNHRLNGK